MFNYFNPVCGCGLYIYKAPHELDVAPQHIDAPNSLFNGISSARAAPLYTRDCRGGAASQPQY
jgi:hypothetical protein